LPCSFFFTNVLYTGSDFGLFFFGFSLQGASARALSNVRIQPVSFHHDLRHDGRASLRFSSVASQALIFKLYVDTEPRFRFPAHFRVIVFPAHDGSSPFPGVRILFFRAQVSRSASSPSRRLFAAVPLFRVSFVWLSDRRRFSLGFGTTQPLQTSFFVEILEGSFFLGFFF